MGCAAAYSPQPLIQSEGEAAATAAKTSVLRAAQRAKSPPSE